MYLDCAEAHGGQTYIVCATLVILFPRSFDFTHFGHANFLRQVGHPTHSMHSFPLTMHDIEFVHAFQAKSCGDFLIVGIHSDGE